MDRRRFLTQTSTAAGALVVAGQASAAAPHHAHADTPTFRRPKKIIPVPAPSKRCAPCRNGGGRPRPQGAKG